TFTSPTIGTVIGNAHVTVTINGVALLRDTAGNSGPGGSGPATKRFINMSTTLSVTDQIVGVPLDATGSVSYVVYPDRDAQTGQCTGLRLAAGGGPIVTPGVAPSSNTIPVPDGQKRFFVATYTGNLPTFVSNCVEGAFSNTTP